MVNVLRYWWVGVFGLVAGYGWAMYEYLGMVELSGRAGSEEEICCYG